MLVHQKVAHRISPNYSPHIRYQCYFRLSHRDHRAWAPLRGLWSNFEGLARTGAGGSGDGEACGEALGAEPMDAEPEDMAVAIG